MSRHDLHAEREWQAQMAERRTPMKRNKVPRDNGQETMLMLVIVMVLNVLALIGVVAWVLR
jgi:flagellar basal body-associated protein FliL